MTMAIQTKKQFSHSLWTLAIFLSVSIAFVACKDQNNPESESIEDPSLRPACEWGTGGGKITTGGAGGAVYMVSSLADTLSSGGSIMPGTLRYAVQKSGARVIIFNVAGVIHLTKPLVISNPNISILGQSAPGEGICIADYPVQIKGTQNVILRFLHIRMGDSKLTAAEADGADALSVNNCKNVLIDHCSFSWSTDECVSCYANEDFTLQYCFITESLRKSKHDKGNHGYGGIWGGKNATFHHNLLAHHDSRNPRFDHDYVDNACHGPIDYVNNVVYNWGGNSTYGGESVSEARKINMVANYYKYGPATSPKYRLLNATTYCTNCTSSGQVQPGSFYLKDNYMFESPSVTADNWSGVIIDNKGTASVDDCKSATRHEMLYDVKTQSAEEAFETVLAKAGCSLHRDAIDERIAGEVRNGTYTYTGSKSGTKGIIDRPSDVGGWPAYEGVPEKDTDRDGIPDAWETAHKLDPKRSDDASKQTLVPGYTNLEVYLNNIVAHLY